MTGDLIARLRDGAAGIGWENADLARAVREAAAALEQRDAEIARLREVIREALTGAARAQDGNLREEMVLIRQPAFAALCRIAEEEINAP